MAKKSEAQKRTAKTKKKRGRTKTGTPASSGKKTAGMKEKSRKTVRKEQAVKSRRKGAKKDVTTEKKRGKDIKRSKGGEGKKPVAKKIAAKRLTGKKPVSTSRKKGKKTETPSRIQTPPKPVKVGAQAKKGRAEKKEASKKITQQEKGKIRKKVSPGKKAKPKRPEERSAFSKKRGRPRTETQEVQPSKAPERMQTVSPRRRVRPPTKTVVEKIPSIEQVTEDTGIKKPRQSTEDTFFEESKGRLIAAKELPPVISIPSARMDDLPSEYGENSVTLMIVNPCKIFSFWEVRRETLKVFKGILNLRVYDVTGIDFTTTAAHSLFDVVVSDRIGKRYLDVSPEKDYVADIGILYNGIFIGIARSQRVSTPRAGIPGEKEFLPEKLDIGIRVGY